MNTLNTYLRCLHSQTLYTYEDIEVFHRVIKLFIVEEQVLVDRYDDITQPPRQ